jgi:hypothetical protein
MLAYYINNAPLLLDEQSSNRITWYNPACFFDSIPGDVAMGINIPVNDVNRALLGNPERFEKYSTTPSAAREIQAFEIRYSGVLLLAGTLMVQGFAGGNYSCWLRSNLGNMGKEHREKYIYDIPAFNQNIRFTNKAAYTPGTDHYGCPEIVNPGFFRDKGRRKKYTRQVLNPEWEEGNGEPQLIDEEYETEIITKGFENYAFSRVNERNPDNTIKLGAFLFGGIDFVDTLPITVVSPMLFLDYVIDSLLRDARFTIIRNDISANDDLKTLIIYNNFDITRMGFSTVQNIKFNNPFYDGETLHSHTVKIDFISRDYNDAFQYRDLLPKVKLKDFILGIQNMLNVCFQFLRDGKVNIIDRETIITSTAIDISDYVFGEWEKDEKKDVTLKFEFSHDQDDNIFRERWEDIDDRRPDEKEPVSTIADLDLIAAPAVGEVRFVRSHNIYMQYAWTQRVVGTDNAGDEISEDHLGWTYLAGNFQNAFFNRGTESEETIKTPFSTVMWNILSQVPEVQQPGNIKSIKFAYQNFSPRLLFYKPGNEASFETENIALDWEKTTTGLLATRWPKWARFWCQRQPVSRSATLPLNVLDYMVRNITGKFRTREGEFIIETIETEFGLNSIGPSKITGYKNDYAPKAHEITRNWAPENLVLMDEMIDFTGFDNMNFNI